MEKLSKKVVEGEVFDVNEYDIEKRTKAMHMAKRYLMSVFEGTKLEENIEGTGTISLVSGEIMYSIIDTFKIGVCGLNVCIKGSKDTQWHYIDMSEDIMNKAPYFKKAEQEANRNLRKDFHLLKVGDFVYGTNNGSKMSDVVDYLRCFLNNIKKDDYFALPCVCLVERIEELTEQQLDKYAFMATKPKGFGGGSFSEDVPDEFKWNGLDYAQQNSWIQKVCILRTPTRWVAVDPQGYDYCRYVHFPLEWRTMFKEDIKKAEQKEREYQAYIEAEEERRRMELQAKYDERAKRIMDDTNNLDCIKPIEWDKRGAQNRCNNAIKKVLNAVFGIDFKVSRPGYGTEVEWTCGPSEHEVMEILESMSGDKWDTGEVDWSDYGATIYEYRDNDVTRKIGKIHNYYTRRKTA